MAIINANAKFVGCKKMSVPIVKIPKNVKQIFNIDKMYKNGIAKLEPGNGPCLYDRCYLFDEINYFNKDPDEKDRFLNMLMSWFKSMNLDFKITVANEYQSISDFLEGIRGNKNKNQYPDIDDGISQWIHEKLESSSPNVNKVRLLTVSCRGETSGDAMTHLNTIDTTIENMFQSWHGKILQMNGEERLLLLHSLLCNGKKEEEEFIYLDEKRYHDWKNDVFPKSLREHDVDYVHMDDTYLSVMFGWKYARSIDSDDFIHELSNMEFPSFVTMDFAPVPPGVIVDKLVSASMDNEKHISNEQTKKNRAGLYSQGVSYYRQRKKDELEALQDQMNVNDETGYFMNLLIVVTAGDIETLEKRIKETEEIGKNVGVKISTAYGNQLKALNTAMPYGGRQVDYMRFILSSSAVAFQPYHAQDIAEKGGYMYGLNRTTKRLIFGNRKLLMNPHGIIIGHSGSGKSVIIKVTEILQTLLSTDDDILVLDPQNEFADIIRNNGGSYFDFTPKSNIYLNGFEVPEEVFQADKLTREKFIATQMNYARNVTAAIMSNIPFTGEHGAFIERCVRRMYDKVFSKKKMKAQPTLRDFREEIRKEMDKADNFDDARILRPIYNSLERYTEGSCDMLAYPSNIRMDNRMVGFGLKNVPEENWEAVMVTIMHYTSSRMEYNQKLQRATHFIVDETQVISRKGTSAEQLNAAVATFRKFGGICTMAMQNLTAALENPKLKELFSNCSYKCFLDQGGVDARALAEIQELSQTEFNALNTDEVGKGVMVWGKKVVLFDARISKENSLYQSISTNFYEERRPKEEDGLMEGKYIAEVLAKDEAFPQNPMIDRTEEIILQMAEYQAVTVKDILYVIDDIHREDLEDILSYLCQAGQLKEINDSRGICYERVV
ncbi:MAG: DUF87 domain-containing protein [Eubacteriales bacterium]|nr:DUF87 domain-containing protein [Eubacteriales bacterium]